MNILSIFVFRNNNELTTTKMTNNFRTEVFRRAYRLTLTGINFSQALTKSWAIYRLQKQMRSSVVEFRFRKISGEIRIAYGTLIKSVIDPLIKGVKESKNETLVTYFDTQKQQFRSFREENLILI
ncbi:MAG: SH3 beta-barrel fold-containing protein [Bacteroidales bacterium]|nr:SH3 beta-barrel fold-containing protein [Bacteroidales bacterium]